STQLPLFFHLDDFSKILLVIAVAFGTINIVGGFLVTDRMLDMFKSRPKPKQEDEESTGGKTGS
ncbi:MAG: proton-translocating transhydrogenase family protein, partial [Solirubrobacteraceae bacterium]